MYALSPAMRPWSLMSTAVVTTAALPAAAGAAGSCVNAPFQVNGARVVFGFARSVDPSASTTPELLTPIGWT